MKGLFRQHDKLYRRCFTGTIYSACHVFCKSKCMILNNVRIKRNIFINLTLRVIYLNNAILHLCKCGKLWNEKLGWRFTNTFEGMPSLVCSKHGEPFESSESQCECLYHSFSWLQVHSNHDVQSPTPKAFSTSRETNTVVKLIFKHICSNLNMNLSKK